MVIIDTSVWIAFLYTHDSQHKIAKDIMENINQPIGIPEYIAGEVITVLQRVSSKNTVNSFIENLDQPANKGISVLTSSPEFFSQTIAQYTKLTTNTLSFIDVSLIIWSQTHEVITFDKQLKKYLPPYGHLENPAAQETVTSISNVKD